MITTKQRCILLFEESIKSKYTKKNYISHLNSFMKFAKINSYDELLVIRQSQFQHMLQDYLIGLKCNTSPNTIPSKFQGIKHFCVMNEIDLNWKVIYKMFPQKRKAQSLRSYTTKEISAMLDNARTPRDQALIHFLASTGARIGVFDHELLIGHMKKMPIGCSAVKLYAGYIEEYWAFLTPQATKAINAYHNHRRNKGEILSDNSPIFVTRHRKSKHLGWSGARSVVYRTLSRSGILRSKQNSRYDVQADHGFRKRFNTILKLNGAINYNIAEKLMGHKNGLDGIYLTPTLDELFLEFKKVMPEIEI